MRTIIVGGGKVGYYLAQTLLEHGHDLAIIEKSRKTCEYLANQFDIPVECGDATQLDTLKNMRMTDEDSVVCVTGNDEDNLICCELAKTIFHVRKTVAKVNNPKNVEVMERLGVDNVINSTNNIASLIEREVDASSIKQLLSINHGNALIQEIQLPDDYVYNGRKLKDFRTSEAFNIISIMRDDYMIIPRGNAELHSGDKLLVIMESDGIRELCSILKVSKK